MGCQPSTNHPSQPICLINSTHEDAHIDMSQFMLAKTSSIFDEYQFLGYISRNTNSYLRQVRHLKSGIERVVKVYYRVKKNETKALNEINAIMQLDHPNVTRLLEYFLDATNIYIVYEKIEGEELFSHLLGVEDHVRQNFPAIFQQLLLVIQYCHSKGYAHLNIIPDNIMISNKNGSYLLKLVGFSHAFEFKQRANLDQNSFLSYTQTHINVNVRMDLTQESYQAPEKIQLKHVEKADIWMIGILLLMVITGRNLFIEVDKEDINEVIDSWASEHPTFDKLIDLVRHMLDSDPASRYSAEQCLAHPFMLENHSEMYKWRMALVYNFLHSFKPKNRLRKLFQISMLHRISSVHDQTEFLVEFTNLDRNKDGILQKEELVQGLLNSYSISEADAEKYVEEIFHNLDRNKNNNLEYSEFLLGTMRVSKIINDKNIENLFKEMDTNEDGYISQEEIKTMFYDVCLDDEIFSNEKGMTLREFKEFMMEMSKGQ